MTDPKEIICMISTTILAVFGIVQSYHGIKNRVKNIVSWRVVEKGAANLLSQMRKDQYFPDAIIAMGRGGAVLAGLISNKFYKEKNIPIFMVDRDMSHDHGVRRIKIRNDILDFKKAPSSVLLIAGINASGATFEEYSKWLLSNGTKKIRTAVLVESLTSKCESDFYFKQEAIDPRNLKMPWYKGGIIDWKPQ